MIQPAQTVSEAAKYGLVQALMYDLGLAATCSKEGYAACFAKIESAINIATTTLQQEVEELRRELDRQYDQYLGLLAESDSKRIEADNKAAQATQQNAELAAVMEKIANATKPGRTPHRSDTERAIHKITSTALSDYVKREPEEEKTEELGSETQATLGAVDARRQAFDYAPWVPPFWYCVAGNQIFDSENHLVFDLRGWGYLTGMGHGACKMDEGKAVRIQDVVGERVARLMSLDAEPVSSLPTQPVDSVSQPKAKSPASSTAPSKPKDAGEWTESIVMEIADTATGGPFLAIAEALAKAHNSSLALYVKQSEEARKDATDSAPYWLCYAMADSGYLQNQDCERGGDTDCNQTDDCITEWCVVCAAKAWLKGQGQTLSVSSQTTETTESVLGPQAISESVKREDVQELVDALKGFLDTWLRLVNSGDAGFWNPEDDDCVKAARAALSRFQDKHDSGGKRSEV